MSPPSSGFTRPTVPLRSTIIFVCLVLFHPRGVRKSFVSAGSFQLVPDQTNEVVRLIDPRSLRHGKSLLVQGHFMWVPISRGLVPGGHDQTAVES